MLVFDYEIKLPSVNKLIKDYGLEPYGKTQYIVDSTIVQYSQPYTPKDTGLLEGSVMSSIGSGELVYAPSKEGAEGTYASYVWYGTNLHFQKNNPYSTHHWVEAAMKVHLQDVCRDVEKKIKEMQNGR